MRCTVCGARAVTFLGSIYRPTGTRCTYCGATEGQDAPTPPPAQQPPLAGGAMLSPVEQADFGRMFGLDALEELLGRGPEG